MATQFILKVEHIFSEGAKINFISSLPFPVLTYLVILAIDTPHIAIAKEYRPRSLTPRNDGFFPVVSADCSDYG